MLKKLGDELYEADFIIFNTNSWPKRPVNFEDYGTDFAAVGAECAEWMRMNLPKLKAVAIDTLSIENIAIGKQNGFRTHKAFLDPARTDPHDTHLRGREPRPRRGQEDTQGLLQPAAHQRRRLRLQRRLRD